MATNYQKFLIVLVKWPINPKRKALDYALHLRTLLKRQNSNGDFFPGEPADATKKFESLIRLGDNKYGLKYPFTQDKGASCMVRENISAVLTDEFIDYFNNSQGFIKKLFK